MRGSFIIIIITVFHYHTTINQITLKTLPLYEFSRHAEFKSIIFSRFLLLRSHDDMSFTLNFLLPSNVNLLRLHIIFALKFNNLNTN